MRNMSVKSTITCVKWNNTPHHLFSLLGEWVLGKYWSRAPLHASNGTILLIIFFHYWENESWENIGQEHHYFERTHSITLLILMPNQHPCFSGQHWGWIPFGMVRQKYFFCYFYSNAKSTPLLLRTALRVDSIWYGRANLIFHFEICC